MAHERPLAHWPSYALLARASWYPRRTFAELVGRSRSWVEMAETGHRVPYNVLDLVSVARALRVDLAAFLCDPIPDLPDGEQQQLLATLRDASMGDDPRAGLARLAHRRHGAWTRADARCPPGRSMEGGQPTRRPQARRRARSQPGHAGPQP